MKRVSDVIADLLVAEGVSQVFMVTGGGAMHLNDALTRNPKLEVCFNHHEQACAMAADAYSRLSGRMAAVNVTTGPGGINALNGVFGAYTDSIAMIVISGQVKRETIAANYDKALRQLGDQEVDIVSMARPVTKYATSLQNPLEVKSTIQKALFLAKNGRPGPVWIDVPVDVQSVMVDENALAGWSFDERVLRGDRDLHLNTLKEFGKIEHGVIDGKIDEVLEKLSSAKRPAILIGTGLRISGALEKFKSIAKTLGIPLTTAWNAHDAVEDDDPCYCGRPGTVGDRPGNFTVQNSDFLLILGCRLNIRQISYNWGKFASKAFKIHVDIDSSELQKPTLSTQLRIHADLNVFLDALAVKVKDWKRPAAHQSYLTWCKERVIRYPVVHEKFRGKSGKINPYVFMGEMYQALPEGSVVVAANATASVPGYQAAKIKRGTRLLGNSGSASMGFDLPAAIGASLALGKKRAFCLAGDGSIMMNLQELQTISGNHLPVTVFLLNNSGYHSIRQTQKNYFSDNMKGIDAQTGVSFPNFEKLASAFGFGYVKIETETELLPKLSKVLSHTGPLICEVILDETQDFEPKLMSRKLPDGTMVSPSLEDMAPFLDRAEFATNVIED